MPQHPPIPALCLQSPRGHSKSWGPKMSVTNSLMVTNTRFVCSATSGSHSFNRIIYYKLKKKSQTQSALPSAKTKQDSVYNPLWNWCRKVKECIFLRFKVGFLAKICFPDGVIDLDSTESSQAAWRAWKFPGTWAGKSRESPQTGTGSASMGRNTDHVQEKGWSCSSQGVGNKGERESCNSQYIIFNGQHWFTVQFKILQVCRKFLQLFHHRKRILLY